LTFYGFINHDGFEKKRTPSCPLFGKEGEVEEKLFLQEGQLERIPSVLLTEHGAGGKE
jgi:hypothetical protein